MRFMIRGPEGQEYELSDLDYFKREYAPNGFAIVANPPAGYDVPDLSPPKKVAAVKDDGKAKDEAKS